MKKAELKAKIEFLEEQLEDVCCSAKMYEKKLRKIMTKDDYENFMHECFIEMRNKKIDELPEGDFKDFLIALAEKSDSRKDI